MAKGLYWVFVIALGVFIGTFAQTEYREYKAGQILEQLAKEAKVELAKEQARQRAMQQKQEAEADRRQAAREAYRLQEEALMRSYSKDCAKAKLQVKHLEAAGFKNTSQHRQAIAEANETCSSE